jgi:hypothetical protein
MDREGSGGGGDEWIVLTLFLVEHMSALDRVVNGNALVELPSTGRLSHPISGGKPDASHMCARI